ncbi:MAG TPA: carbohydrate porin [Candidatus Saccharimonadales bacterium]|jgi:high affinity Mn2+ porin|nr:carbohydrate porin [Candidatus Saccharimonadales bacterium]
MNFLNSIFSGQERARAVILVLLLQMAGYARGQSLPTSADSAQPQPQAQAEEAAPITTMWKHSETSRFWISGQENVIVQGHPAFSARYSGPNSLKAQPEARTSFLTTLFLGVQPVEGTELLLDFESASGHGISDALGVAGFTNLDVVRNPLLSAKPYLARLQVRQVLALTQERSKSARGPLSLATELPARRLEFRAGKFGTADFFDVNAPGSDSHLQFLNWTVDANGAYDYAADTRGYTWGAVIEFQDRNWGVRFGEMLMPKVANGPRLEWNLRKAHAENVEAEFRHSWLPQRAGVIRFLSYVNHANMGSYRDAVGDFLARRTRVPDITAHPQRTTIKYGFGLNTEQEVTARLRVFARLGWNEGQHETFAYTEVDSTGLLGADYRGDRWKRSLDKVGAAVVSNGISKDHALYLKLGGQGFLLGDGNLTYGREWIIETYYNLHLWRGIFTAANLQYITNPGYNRDRGPVAVPGIRLHVDF